MQRPVKRAQDGEGWSRCAEGFSDFFTNDVTPSNSNKKKRKSTDGYTKSNTFTPGNIFEKLAFGSEETSQSITWSSSENEEDKKQIIEPIKKRKKLSPRPTSRKTRSSLRNKPNPVDNKEVIILSNSDTEREEKIKEPEKTDSVKVSLRKRKQNHTVHIKEVVILSGSESEKEENVKESQGDQGVTLSGKSDVVSIKGYESDQDQKEWNTRETTPPPSQELNSQTSISISTSSSFDTQSGIGMKASDWVKSLQLKTPIKTDQNPTLNNVEDSAKKKKKHSRGGLAEQLTRLQNRDKSSVRVWKHQQATHLSSSQDARSVCLEVTGFETLHSLQLLRCRTINTPGNTVTTQTDTPTTHTGISEDRLVMIPVSQAEQLKLQTGMMVKIYPPWQQLELSTGQQIMLCTKYCHVLDQADVQMDVKHVTETGQHEVKPLTAVWNCPCAQGLCRSQSLCPAYQFPCIPGYVQECESSVTGKAQETDNNSNTLKAASTSVDTSISASTSTSAMAALSSCKITVVSSRPVITHLHTVGLKSVGSKTKSQSSVSSGTSVFDSVLESIESEKSKGDNQPSCLCFKGHVHKMVEVHEGGKVKSYELFVEDMTGTVCVIKLSCGTIQNLEVDVQCIEGKTFQFSGLNVQERITWERDPQLLSMVDKVWSGTVCNKLASQDTEELDQELIKTREPVGYCYILEEPHIQTADLLPCLVDLYPEREPSFQSLSDIIRPSVGCLRYDCVVRIVYLHCNEKKRGELKGLYVIDGTRTVPVCVKYKPYNKESSLTIKQAMNGCKLIRDLCVHNGEAVLDIYSTIVNTSDVSSLESNSEAIQYLQNLRVVPPLLTGQSHLDDMISVSGVICEVDEDSAYSWEACLSCGSDQIQIDAKTGVSKCNDCKKTHDGADVKMKMEVIVKVNNTSLKVKVDLLQSTIERLLPKDEEDEDGYELSSVLNKHIGPLNCLVTQTGKQWAFFLKEIEL